MLCPECSGEDHKVIDTQRPTNDDTIERVRRCQRCGHPWVTEETKKKKTDQEVR